MRLIVSILLCVATALGALSAPLRELRGAWVATSLGIDWPRRETDPEAQVEALRTMLDRLQKAHFNTVFVEMQGRGDVLWPSILQPASEDVTGNARMPLAYDVAQVFIDEAHARGMDVYAVVSPLNVGTRGGAHRYADNRIKHILSDPPGWVSQWHGDWYIDPGNTDAREYITDLYTELVAAYPFDGLVVDGLCLPSADFDDRASYADYNHRQQTLDDWRQDCLDDLVREIRDVIDTYRPEMRLLLTAEGMETYDDEGRPRPAPSVVTLLDEEVIDLVVPKLYERGGRGFAPALDSWTGGDYSTRTIVAITPERATDFLRKPAPEPGMQIEMARQADDSIAGVVVYRVSMIADTDRPAPRAQYKKFKDDIFIYPAHQPLLSTRDVTTPYPPENVQAHRNEDGHYVITWEESPTDSRGTPIKYYTVYVARQGDVDVTDIRGELIHAVEGTEVIYPSAEEGLEFAVTAFDANNYESRPALSSSTGDYGLQEREYVFNYYADVLTISGPRVISRVEIYNSWGKRLKHIVVGAEEMSADCADLPGGVYIVHTVYADGATRVNKFIK